MKYSVWPTRQAAEQQCRRIFSAMLRERAKMNGGKLDDWSKPGRPSEPVSGLNDDQISDGRFPLYGQRADTGAYMTERGHTTSWAEPVQISDGRWVFPSPDGTGEEAKPSWWPDPALLSAPPSK